jgi:uncharacterized protein (TIGR00288 family)
MRFSRPLRKNVDAWFEAYREWRSLDMHIALLIDCDNSRPGAIQGILGELAEQGAINIRRAYANWRRPVGWEPKLLPFGIQPIQQFVYRKGKNAVDMCMTIDAIDLLYTERVDCFALVTNDGDFTPLVHKLLSKGKVVIVFGETTSDQLIQACSIFVHTGRF